MLHGHGSLFGEAAIGGNEMPWFVEERVDQWCVVKGTPEDPIETVACHETEDAAQAQMRALYASEGERAETPKPETEKRSDNPDDFLVVEDREKPTTWHLPVKENGTPNPRLMGAAWAALHEGFRGRKYEGPDKSGALKRLIALYRAEDMELPTEKEQQEEAVEAQKNGADSFTVYKSADGSYRWASVSSVAVKDKEFEIVTEKAQDDAIQHANDTGEFGEIDLVHIDGTDVGKCDLMVRVGKRLIEGGSFDNTELAKGAIKALQDDPDYWGVSIKFVYDPSKFDGEKYNGNIRIRKRTILPQEMAASYGTKLVAIGGENPMEKELSPQALEALARLNVSEEKIESLAEKQVEPEPNTVTKEEQPAAEPEALQPETVEVEKGLWERIKSAFVKPEVTDAAEPDAETGGEEMEEDTPVEAQEKDLDVAAQDWADVIIDSMVEAVSKSLAQRDEQLTTLGEAVLILSQQVKELQAPIEDRIEKRLSELPPVVKAAPSVTATTEQPAGATLPFQDQKTGTAYTNELISDVRDAIERGFKNLRKVQV